MQPIAVDVFEKIGYCPASATGEYAISQIATTPYVFPSAAMGMEVYSSDNTNDKAGGTGALTVEIKYLTNTFREKSEIVTVNGTTVVATVATDIFRVNSFRVLTAGSTRAATGKIDLRNLADTPIYASIAIGQTDAKQIIYTVPAGRKLIIDEIYVSNTAATALKHTTVFLKSGIGDAAATTVFEPRFQIGLDQSTLPIVLENPIVVLEKRDVMMSCIGIAAGIVNATVRGRLEA
jgi:hypothetical protein